MTFKPKIWYPISVVLSGANLVAVWFAALPAEPLHATIHATLALGFGLWAQRLRSARMGSELTGTIESPIDAIELEMGRMRDELTEAQERLDFAERMLAQRSEQRRDDPER